MEGLRGSLDVETFGVARSSTADQSAAMQRAFDEAAVRGTPLFLPAGAYRVANLSLPSGLTVYGVPGLSRLILSGGDRLALGQDAENIYIAGVGFDGAGVQLEEFTGLLQFDRVRKLTLDECVITDAGGNGIFLEQVSGTIRACEIAGARGAALHSYDAQELAITDNHVHDCADNGILVWRWEKGDDGTQIIGNRVERIGAASGGTGPFGNGINAFRADNVMVANNTIDNCVFSAIRFNSASNGQIIGNHARNLGEVAIYAEFAFDGSVIANNLVDGAATGVSVTNFGDGGRLAVVQGNLIRNVRRDSLLPTGGGGYGSGISVEADIAITGNVIEGAEVAGLTIGWGPYLRDVTATGNVIRNAGIGIEVTVVEGAETALISTNVISNVERGALLGMRWYDPATPELISAKVDTLPANIVATGNILTG